MIICNKNSFLLEVAKWERIVLITSLLAVMLSSS